MSEVPVQNDREELKSKSKIQACRLIVDELDKILSRNGTELTAQARDEIVQMVCIPEFHSLHGFSYPEKLVLASLIGNIIGKLRIIDPDFAQRFQSATHILNNMLKEGSEHHREPGEVRASVSNVLSPQADARETTWETYAKREFAHLRKIINELKAVESFSAIEIDSKVALLGSLGQETYINLISRCGQAVFDEYLSIVYELRGLMEQKKDDSYEKMYRKPLEDLIVFLESKKK